MGELSKKFRAAIILTKKYQNLPRAGWVVKGSRAKSNEAILVPRQEVVKLADDLASCYHNGLCWMYENFNLQGYLDQLATGENDAVVCDRCENTYRTGWLDGKCPYCEAADAASNYVHEMLRGQSNE